MTPRQPRGKKQQSLDEIGIETGLKYLAFQRKKKLSKKDKGTAVLAHLCDASGKLASPNNNEIGRAIWKRVNENARQYIEGEFENQTRRDEILEAFQEAGALARREKGKTRDISKAWNDSEAPERDRASIIAKRFNVTAGYVRKVVRERRLRS